MEKQMSPQSGLTAKTKATTGAREERRMACSLLLTSNFRQVHLISEIKPPPGLGSDFFYLTPKVQSIKAKTDKWDYMKPKSFYTAKETISGVKTQPTEWKKT